MKAVITGILPGSREKQVMKELLAEEESGNMENGRIPVLDE